MPIVESGQNNPLAPDERAVLEKWAAGRRFPLRLVQRAQIICKAAEGLRSKDIASINIFFLTRLKFVALKADIGSLTANISLRFYSIGVVKSY